MRADRSVAGQVHVGVDEILFQGDADLARVADAERELRRELRRRHVGEGRERHVGRRMPKGRELPVQHGDHLGLILGKDHVVDPQVAMHKPRHVVTGGQRLRKPLHQTLHR
eukprot:scaffold14061_cov118-Isochrysis_galbana.AAC.5